jgi:putative phosphoribosyl transferase
LSSGSPAPELIVGGADVPVIGMNQQAMALLRTEKQLQIIPGATHLFEEPGALEAVARLAQQWFQRYLISARAESSAPATNTTCL